MPKALDEDQMRRRKALQEKRAARRRAKEENDSKVRSGAPTEPKDLPQDEDRIQSAGNKYSLVDLPEDSIRVLFSFLNAAELGRLILTCKSLNRLLSDARVSYILSRLDRNHSFLSYFVGRKLCQGEAGSRNVIDSSYGGGDTGRILPRGKYAKSSHNEFIAYARFLEESVLGYSYLSTGGKEPIFLPHFVKGRFVSVSPEHSLARVGGDGFRSGPGGSGVASWGVGRRGQLGHGRRKDERLPLRLHGGLGYGIRVVQVAAGGGLVRVAHSLLLTSTGRVLSFGVGQYGALGQGYSSAKQLPDVLRPQYVEALSGIRCTCVAAGELHSAVVTSDGDVYTWGDGFCGQLGHGDKRPRVAPKQVVSGGLEDECVSFISCGARHTLAVTEDGELFSFGLGHFGALGRSYTAFDYDADAAVAHLDPAVENTLAQAPPVAIPEAVDANPEPVTERRNFAAELLAHLDLIQNLSLDDSSNQCIPVRVEALKETKIVGASAGHRHSLVLDQYGSLFSFGSNTAGCLGLGNTESQMYPMKITSFEDDDVQITSMSAGVDMSMAVSTNGTVYAWGKTDGGRIGLGQRRGEVTIPRRVTVVRKDGSMVKGIDVECGFVHSLVVGLDGTLHMCGGVGVEGENDGQTREDPSAEPTGEPRMMDDFNIWHRLPEPKEEVQATKWSKYGKYEIQGRSRMLETNA